MLDQHGLEGAKLLLVFCALGWQFLDGEWETKSNQRNSLKFPCIGVLPSAPSLCQLGASSGQRHAEQARDVCWGCSRAGCVVLGTVVAELHQNIHSAAQSAGNHQDQAGALSGWFKLIRLQLWRC